MPGSALRLRNEENPTCILGANCGRPSWMSTTERWTDFHDGGWWPSLTFPSGFPCCSPRVAGGCRLPWCGYSLLIRGGERRRWPRGQLQPRVHRARHLRRPRRIDSPHLVEKRLELPPGESEFRVCRSGELGALNRPWLTDQ